MAEGGYSLQEIQQTERLDLTDSREILERNMEIEAPAAASSNMNVAETPTEVSEVESKVDQFFQQSRCDRMSELRQLQLGAKPVTNTEHRVSLDHFFSKRIDAQEHASSYGKENVPVNVDNVEEHRPDTIVVEIQGLSDQRPVSNVLTTNFRRQLEGIIRGSISSVTRNHTPRPTPPRPTPSPRGTSSPSPVPSPRADISPPRAVPRLFSSLVDGHRSRSSSVLSSSSSSSTTATSHHSQDVPVNVNVPEDVPDVRDPIPQMFDRLVGYDIGDVHREDMVQEISELVHRRLVSATLASDFRRRMEFHMQERLVQTGTDGERVQEFIQNIQPSQHIARNDFSNLGIADPTAPADNWDNISVTSVSATAVPYTQTNLYMSREIAGLKAQLMEMKNMMKLSFDLQMDIQRSIRQEVAAAMNDTQNASGMRAGHVEQISKPVNDSHCLICLDKHSDCVLYQCGHMCVCFGCGKNLISQGSKCPVCRAPIKDIIRAYKC